MLIRQGHGIIGYMDDLFLKGETYESCVQNVTVSVNLLRSLGFIIHPNKSALIPTQKAQFLGFIIDSLNMTVSLTSHKKQFITENCTKLLDTSLPTIRQVARVIGILVAAFPGVQFERVWALEREKIQALKQNRGDFDKRMSLPVKAYTELEWWIGNISHAYKPITHDEPDY